MEIEKNSLNSVQRRHFLESLTAAAVWTGAPALAAAAAENVIERGDCRVVVAPDGNITSFKFGTEELLQHNLGANQPQFVIFRERICNCDRPVSVRRDESGVVLRYEFPGPYPLTVDYGIGLIPAGRDVALKQTVRFHTPKNVPSTLVLRLPKTVRLGTDRRKVFLPLKSGVGRKQPIRGLDHDDEYVFQVAGSFVSEHGEGTQNLAIPLAEEYADNSDLHITHCADPLFTTYLRLPHGERPGEFNCLYPGSPGIEREEQREVYTIVHKGDFRQGLRLFRLAALTPVDPGPDWTHEVALQEYDYFGKNGRGWFADIDRMAELIKPADRPKVAFALHGWYGCVGPYNYDARTRSLNKTWVAFPSAQDPAFQAQWAKPPGSGLPYIFRPDSLKEMRPVEMSLADMHRRCRYAKDKGFRVILYYACGLQAPRGLKDSDPPEHFLHPGGWRGPDTIGQQYIRNPLVSEVRDFYRGFLEALIEEFRKELDGYVFDLSDSVGPEELGTAAHPGYAGRAMMTLIKELTLTVQQHHRDAAFLGSDYSYATFTHGGYADLACLPSLFPRFFFQNYGNILWACNWAPVTLFPFTKYAVEAFDAPVALSGGPFGDNIGPAEMKPEVMKRVLELFERRKSRRMDLGWIEEPVGPYTYGGRVLTYRVPSAEGGGSPIGDDVRAAMVSPDEPRL